MENKNIDIPNVDERVETILKTIQDIQPLFDRINETICLYTRFDGGYDLNLFESVKRELIDILTDFVDYHSKFKSMNSKYVEKRKTAKAFYIENLLDGGQKITAASINVYNVEGYKNYMKLVDAIEKVHEAINSKYYLVQNTLDAVQQSIAIARSVESKN